MTRLTAAQAGVRVLSEAQGTLLWQIRASNMPEATAEYRFHPTRRWAFDIAMPDIKLAVEVEGGLYVEGRHVRGQSFEADAEKYAEAMCLGWRVLRVSTRQVTNGQAIGWLRRLVEEETSA